MSLATITTLEPFNINNSATFTFANTSVTANISAGNLKTDNLLYANGVAWNLNGTYSNSNVAAYLPTYTGNVSANYFIGNGSTLTSIAGANVTGQVGNALVAGTVYTAAQPNITSVGTLTSLSVTGNVSGANFTGNHYGSGSALSSITGANVTGQVGNSLVAGTVYTAAQPNITSVGTLSSLTVTANVAAGNILTDHLLYSNGVAWSLGGGGGTPGGSNTQLQFNDAGSFGGSGNLTFNKTSNTLTLTGNANITTINATDVYATGNITSGSGTGGSITGANLINANYFTGNVYTSSQPYITSLGSLTGLTLTSNSNITLSGSLSQISGANLVSATLLTGTLTTTAQPNVTSLGTLTNLTVTGNTTTGNLVVANANITGALTLGNANVTLSNLLSTGNVIAGNIIANTNVIIAGNLTSTLGTNANLTIDPDGTGKLIISTSTPVNMGNSLTVTNDIVGNANANVVANVKIGGTLSLTGNVITASGTNGDITIDPDGSGNLNISSTTPVYISNNLSITGNLNVGGNILDSSGDLTISTTGGTNGNILLNADGTGRISLDGMLWPAADGTSGFYLKTDGAGNLSWAAVVGGGGGGGSGSMTIIDDTTTNGSFYPVWSNVSSGNLNGAYITTTKFQFNPSSGQLTVQDINTLSDATLKINPEPIDDPMAILRQLFGMGFNWADSGKKSYGLMAQMLEKVLPELVGTNAQGQKTVNYIPIIAFLIEAVKRQQDDIDALKAPKK